MDNLTSIYSQNDSPATDSKIGRRRPTIPTGIVTARLGQLKSIKADNASNAKSKTDDESRLGWGHRANSGFVIPASRSTVFHHVTPPRDRLADSQLADELLAKQRRGDSSVTKGPRTSRSYNVLSVDTPFALRPSSLQAPAKLVGRCSASNDNRLGVTVPSSKDLWISGDGVQDGFREHICHSCGELISLEEPCLSCGHAFCSKCTADIEDEMESPTPTGSSVTPSSPTAPRQPDTVPDIEGTVGGSYSWRNENNDPTHSMSSSSRSVPRARTLPNVYTNQPPRHCLCCIARRPTERRQTEAVLPNIRSGPFTVSRSGSSTATHTTTVSNLRLARDSPQDDALLPAALKTRRSAATVEPTPLKTKSSDPYVGQRLQRPHPHQPEPDVERWPKLRQVPEDSNVPSDEAEEIPWRREDLRKVSKPATDEPRVYNKPKTKPEWVSRLRKVAEPNENPHTANQEFWSRQTPDSPLDRSKQDGVYCDRNRSESVRPSERPVSSNYDEPLAPSSGARTPKSPSLAAQSSRSSLRQIENSLERNHQQLAMENQAERLRQASPAATRNRPRAKTLPPRPSKPSGIMKSPAREKSREHSCLWRDRFMDLGAEVDQLRSELDSCEPADMSPDAETRDHECEDTGIAGLTVVIHLKGRDDLVINTDLRSA